MDLTLNQFLLLVITIAVVVAVTILISLSFRLRKTAKEGEETLVEIRELAKTLNMAGQKVLDKIDDAEEIIQTTKKTMDRLSEITWLFAARIIKPSSKYWPVAFPLLRLGWRQWKKRKEK